MSIYLCLCLSMSIYVYVYLCLCLSMSIYVYLYMSIYVYLSLSMSIYVYLCLSISIYVYLCIYLDLSLYRILFYSVPCRLDIAFVALELGEIAKVQDRAFQADVWPLLSGAQHRIQKPIREIGNFLKWEGIPPKHIQKPCNWSRGSSSLHQLHITFLQRWLKKKMPRWYLGRNGSWGLHPLPQWDMHFQTCILKHT